MQAAGFKAIVRERVTMQRESYKTLSEQAARLVREIMPWDLKKMLAAGSELLVLDVRERSEFEAAHIPGAKNVPRGILEAACEWDYAETEPDLVEARGRPVVVVCRSGNRSALAAVVMQQLGYENVVSLKLGMKGWNDSDGALVDGRGIPVDGDDAMHIIDPRIVAAQTDPRKRKG
jgi:rhodanese-related sulfurtransferase